MNFFLLMLGLTYLLHLYLFLSPYIFPQLNPLFYSKKNEPLWLKPSLKISEILPIVRANRSVQLSYLRIYGVCLTLVWCLFSAFVALNFWHFNFPIENESYVGATNILVSYLMLATGVVSPMFYWLQALLQHRRSGKSIASCCVALQSFQQLALFCYLALTLGPLVEVAKLLVGVSSFHPNLVSYFLLMATSGAVLPLVAHNAIGINRRSFAMLDIRPTGVKSMLTSNLSLKNRAHHKVLNNREFSLELLEGKSDAEIISLIDIASCTGHFEKAELMSRYLLERQ